MVRYQISLDLRRERKKLISLKAIKELAVRGKIEDFSISLQNRYAALAEEADLSIQAVNDKLTGIITECAVVVGGKAVRRDTAKLSQKTQGLIKKRQSVEASNSTDIIKLAEISKLINRRKVADIKTYNMERIEHALKKGGSLKSGEEETRHRQK